MMAWTIINHDELRARFAARLRALKPSQWHRLNTEHGPSDEMCRFCEKTAYELGGLWQYGVRHYICDPCKAEREAAS
jgi:hypothetical protein